MEDNIKDISNNTDDAASEVEHLKSQIDILENNWKRALADYQNLQKRNQEEREHVINFANSTLILKLLFVLDNLQLLAANTEDQGLLLTVKSFKTILDEEGVVEIEILGKSFDPVTMDAIEQVSGKENLVIEVSQKGYMLKDRVLRPARVKVGNGEDLKEPQTD